MSILTCERRLFRDGRDGVSHRQDKSHHQFVRQMKNGEVARNDRHGVAESHTSVVSAVAGALGPACAGAAVSGGGAGDSVGPGSC